MESVQTTRVLKVGPDEPDDGRELAFDLEFLQSLSTEQRFELMMERSRLMIETLRAHEATAAPGITKRT